MGKPETLTMSRSAEPPIPYPLEPPRPDAPPTHPSAAALGNEYGADFWAKNRKAWRKDHAGRKVNREARIAGQVFESVTTDSFPHFEKPVPVQYVVEVLDIMWELGYDGHNLQEIARELEEEGIDFRSGVW